jgi:argininosuccinate lyase
MKSMKKSVEKLWGGRFEKPTAAIVEKFTASVHYEARLVPYDIAGSIAHARMLGRQGIIGRQESARLVAGLQTLSKQWERGAWKLDAAFEDVHGNVEARLKTLVGPLAGKLHTGRSRNDQIALDERLYLREACQSLRDGVVAAGKAFVDLASKNQGLIMPGYTHLQRAQPILFSHWCLAYVEMLLRDLRRLDFARESLNQSPLGAGAVAGSPLPLDRAFVAKQLGFAGVTANSLDTVSDRDYLLDLASAMAVLMVHLSRLGEEIVLFNSQEFGFILLDDSFATGSSLMPQKKNPDVAELLRGRSSRAIGLLVQLLTLMKGQPLAYNRDMQEDKEQFFSTLDLVQTCLTVVPPLLAALKPQGKRMAEACGQGFLEATDAADFLVEQGVPFRQAHEAVGRAVAFCQKQGRTLGSLSVEDWRSFHPSFGPGVLARVSAKASVASRRTMGGTAPGRVWEALKQARKRLSVHP